MPGETVRFDLNDPQFQRNPYPVYRRLRAQPGLSRGGPAQWVVTRYTEITELLRDRRLGREFPTQYQEMSVGVGPAAEFLARIIIDRDPDEHTRLRKLMIRAMNPGSARELKTPVARIVDRLMERARDEGEFDAHADLAEPLPIIVMSDLFNIPEPDRPEIERWSVALAKAFAVFIPEKDRLLAHDAVVNLREYMADLVAQRKRRAGDDLLSRMISVGDGDTKLSDEEIIDNALFVFYAGFETTTNLIATGCAALVQNPDQLIRLRMDRSLLPTAIEEFLRYDAPIHTTTRIAQEPIVICGQKIRPGRVVVLVLASANYDESRFDAPEKLDISRKPNPHVSFGGGVHHCLGAAMARMEGAATFDRLLELFGDISSAGEPVWRPSGGGFRFPYCAYERIPVRVMAR